MRLRSAQDLGLDRLTLPASVKQGMSRRVKLALEGMLVDREKVHLEPISAVTYPFQGVRDRCFGAMLITRTVMVSNLKIGIRAPVL